MGQQETNSGNDDYDEQLARARRFLGQQEYENALRICRRVIQEAPDNARAHAMAGDVHDRRGDYQQAISRYETSLELSFDDGVMQKLAAARKAAFDEAAGGGGDSAASGSGQQQENAAGRPRLLPYLIGAMIALLLMIPVLSYVLVHEEGWAMDETAGPVMPSSFRGDDGGGAASAADRAAATPEKQIAQEGETTADEGKAAPEFVATAHDTNMLEEITLKGAGSEGLALRPVDVAADPHSGLAIVTFRAEAASNSALRRTPILRAAYRGARDVLKADSKLNRIIVRCMTPLTAPEQAGAVMTFRCDITRAAMDTWMKRDDEPDIEQIQNSIIDHIWYRDELFGTQPEDER